MGLWRDLLYRGLRALPGMSRHVRVSAYTGSCCPSAVFTLTEKTSLGPGGAALDLRLGHFTLNVGFT